MGNKQSHSNKSKVNFEAIHSKDKDLETDRLSLGHYIMRELWQANFISPVSDTLKQGARVLDVGTANGTWICELAADYPRSQYVGIDILNLQPSIRPFNVQFIQHDILKGLPFEDNSFDFIHVRELLFDIKESDWNNIVYKELYRVLKPGGWLEIMDPDMHWYDSGPVMTKLCDLVSDRLCSQGINPFIAKYRKELLQSMPGLTLVQQEEKVYPVGPWAGKVGVLTESFIKETCKGFIRWVYPKKNFEKVLSELNTEIKTYKSYWTVVRCCAKKA